jgi:predicted esterase
MTRSTAAWSWLALVVACRPDAGLQEPSRAQATAPSSAPAAAPDQAVPDAGVQADAQADADAPAFEQRFYELDAPAGAWLHPAAPRAETPLVVFLHGMCASPALECPIFRGAAQGAWLLCPPGPAPCSGGGAMWIGTDRQLVAQIDAATAALQGHDVVVPERRALVGYSLGGPAALRVALAEPGRYQRLMIVNASVVPSAAQLEKAQVTRIALVAGERDRTGAKLRRGASTLARGGVDAQFFSLPATGHFFDAESEARLRPALAWLTADW